MTYHDFIAIKQDQMSKYKRNASSTVKTPSGHHYRDISQPSSSALTAYQKSLLNLRK